MNPHSGGTHPLARRSVAREPSFPSPRDHEAGGDPSRYMDILRRRRKLALGIFSAVLLTALVGTLLQSPVYRATALIEIADDTRGVVPTDALFAGREPSKEHLRTQYGILRSEALARRVILASGLLDDPEFGGEGADGSPQSAGSEAMQRAVARFMQRLVVDPVEESKLVRVAFESESPTRAAGVVNELIATFAQMRAEGGRKAARWLDGQMASAAERVRSAEVKLRDYATENGLPYVIDESVSENVSGRLKELQTKLADTRSDRYEKESLYRLVVEGGQFEAVNDRIVEDLTMKLSDVRRDYSRLSTTFTDEYPEAAQARSQITELERLLDAQKRRMAVKVENDYQVALHRERLLEDEIQKEEAAAAALALKSGTYHLLRQEVLSARSMHSALQDKKQEAEVSAAMEAIGLSVVSPAIAPLRPYRPVLAYNLGLALVLGLIMGVGGAFLREYTDGRVVTGEDVDGAAGLPVLALIPSHAFGHGREVAGATRWAGALLRPNGNSNGVHWPRIDRLEGDGIRSAALADAFGALRSAVLFDGRRHSVRSILVSSCRPGEGKTTISTNLALSLARLGYRVLVVDADLRRPCIHKVLNVPQTPGLIQYLEGGSVWPGLVRESSPQGLYVLPSGGATRDAGDLLSDARIERFLREAEKEYDFVILDAPALFVNAYDARLLSRLVDGVVAVVRSESTPRALVARIPEVVGNVIGIIVNDLDPGRLPEYYGDYFAEPEAGSAEPGQMRQEEREENWPVGGRRA